MTKKNMSVYYKDTSDDYEISDVRVTVITREFNGDEWEQLVVAHYSAARAPDGGMYGDMDHYGRYVPLAKNAKRRHAKKIARRMGWL